MIDNNSHDSDSLEELLGQVTPQPAPPGLRPQVLKAITQELETVRGSPWLRRAAIAVAASLLLGCVLNMVVNQRADTRLAQIFGPPQISRQAAEMAKAVEEVTDEQTARWVCEHMTARRRSHDAPEKYFAAVGQLIQELQTVTKDSSHAAPDKDTPQSEPEMDRDRAGRFDGDTSHRKRLVRLVHEYTA